MRPSAATALALLAVALPGGVTAQLAAEPLVVPVPDPLAEVAAGPLGAEGNDLLLYTLGGAGSVQVPYRALLDGGAPTRALDASGQDVAIGRLFSSTPAGGGDLVFVRADGVSVARATSPLVLEPFVLAGGGDETLAVARLLARPEGLLALPTGVGLGVPGALRLWDVEDGVPEGKVVPVPALSGRVTFHTEVYPLRLGAAAVAGGVDDLALPGTGAVALVLQRPGATDVGSLAFDVVRAGDAVAQGSATWLPPGVSQGDALGAAAVDVDRDGANDLVLTLNVWTPPAGWTPGALLWVRNTGTPADFATTPWQDLTDHPDLLLSDPATLRPVDLGTFRGAAVWDRAGDALVVFWTEPGVSGIRSWRAGARGLAIRELVAADVVGSPLPDLVALGFDWTTGAASLLVFADAGDSPPALAWAQGSPGNASRGADHPVTVVATDAQGPVALAWTAAGAPVPGETGATLTLPGASLCGDGPVAVAVRGTDGGGQWRDLAGEVSIVPGVPAFEHAPGSAGFLALAPGGAQLPLVGSIWAACGTPATYTAGGTGLPAEASFMVTPAGPGVDILLTVPEAGYAALLASTDVPWMTLSATGVPAGPVSDLASLPLLFDGTGLVALEQEFGAKALAEGELTVLETRFESRVGVPLGPVTLRLVLEGLAPAGAATAEGATIVGETLVDGGPDRVFALDALPPRGSPVVVRLPVRGTGSGGAAAAEVRSSGGHPLTPAPVVPEVSARLPGCGCASGGADGLAGLVAVLLMATRRRGRPLVLRQAQDERG